MYICADPTDGNALCEYHSAIALEETRILSQNHLNETIWVEVNQRLTDWWLTISRVTLFPPSVLQLLFTAKCDYILQSDFESNCIPLEQLTPERQALFAFLMARHRPQDIASQLTPTARDLWLC